MNWQPRIRKSASCRPERQSRAEICDTHAGLGDSLAQAVVLVVINTLAVDSTILGRLAWRTGSIVSKLSIGPLNVSWRGRVRAFGESICNCNILCNKDRTPINPMQRRSMTRRKTGEEQGGGFHEARHTVSSGGRGPGTRVE